MARVNFEDLDAAGELGAALCHRAAARGAFAVWRAQSRRAWSAALRAGRVERSTHGESSGHGLHVVGADGYTVLASRDDFREDRAVSLVDRVVEAAARGGELGLERVSLPRMQPARAREIPASTASYGRIDLDAVCRRLGELEALVLAEAPGAHLRIGFHAEVDAWRIRRSDGTDVMFAMPRTTLTARASVPGDDGTHGIGVAEHAPRADAPWDEAIAGRFVRRVVDAARLATALHAAPGHPAGSFPVVIDYALAKGLAHEAFGHAAEADGYRTSVLARDGRLRAGDRVGAEHVSIVDEPIPGDHAWQPWSANGVRRERAVVVDHGTLQEGLVDLWSVGSAGSRLTGACRAESFRHAPAPRMSNIRIECAGAEPLGGEFEDYGPQEVRDLLERAGVFRRHAAVSYLAGYGGGQVNTTVGQFVFHCKAIWRLSRDGVVLHRPAIFSGSMFGALHAVREAFGPLRLDALGYCGKWGQSVPSSGGSHWFLVLDPHDDVRLGGR